MKLKYNDLRSRISEEPKWYTREGYPRYCFFKPQETGVYVQSALLVRIACQDCRQEFLVGEGFDRYNFDALITYNMLQKVSGIKTELTEEQIEGSRLDIRKIARSYYFGDPPAHGCVGDTMSCDELEIVEAWERDTEKSFEWVSIPELIGKIQNSWEEE